MAVTRAEKQVLLEELKKLFKDSKSVFFSEYTGLPVKSMQKLRRELRGKKVAYKVAKKTLIRLAAKEIGYNDIPDDVLAGTIAVAVSLEDPLAGAKVVHTLSKEFNQLKLMGGLFDGKILNAADAKAYAMLPSKEELLSKFVFLLQYPVQGFAATLSGTLSKFVRTVDAVRAQKESTPA